MNPPVAPPFPNEDAFFCRFFTELGCYSDRANRRLHEVDFRDEEASGAYVSCPFKDSRNGLLMNRAALKQITGEWPQVTEGIEFFTSLFEVPNEWGLDLSRAWRISLSSMFAPLYLFRRAKHPFANGALPTPVSGVFKIMLDVPTTLDLMFTKGRERGIAGTRGLETAKEIQAFADGHLILLNGEYACAGSPGLIDNVTSTLFENLRFDDQARTRFATYFPDRKEFLHFTYAMTVQYVMGMFYLLSTMVAMEIAYRRLDVDEFPAPPGAAPRAPLSAYERRRRIALEVLMEESNRTGVFTLFAELVGDEARWSVDVSRRLDPGPCLDLSLTLLGSLSGLTAAQISEAHAHYEAKLAGELARVQSAICASIGATGMFSPEIEFDRTTRGPARLLRAICRRAECSTGPSF